MSTHQSSLMSRLMPFVFLAAVIILAAYFWQKSSTSPELELSSEETPQSVTVFPQPKALPTDLNLIDQDGKAFSTEQFKGKWSILFFGYTSCPDICPVEMAILKQTMQYIDKDMQPQVMLVSVDPEKDTPEQLKSYLAKFSDNFVGVTGSIEEITKFTQSVGIYHKPDDPETTTEKIDHSKHDPHAHHKAASSDGAADPHAHHAVKPAITISHSSAYILINPKAEYHALLSAPHVPKQLAVAYQKIIQK